MLFVFVIVCLLFIFGKKKFERQKKWFGGLTWWNVLPDYKIKKKVAKTKKCKIPNTKWQM